MPKTYYDIVPLGEEAYLLKFKQKIHPEILQQVIATEQLINSHLPKGIKELLPAYASLAVFFDKSYWSAHKLKQALQQLQAILPRAISHLPKGRVHEIPVRYGGIHGPDLSPMAKEKGLSEEEFIALHSQKPYLVYMLGFLPGFIYLDQTDQRIQHPRRKQPRLRVAAGSIAIGGAQTGIYTLESPGGWNIIGRTRIRLFQFPKHEEKASPCLLKRGDYVKFVPV